jgi:hypothetical protein
MHKNIFLFLIFFLYFWKFWRKPGILIPDSYFLEMKKKKQTEIKQNSVKQYTRGNYKYWKIFFSLIFFWNGPDPAQMHGLGRTRPNYVSFPLFFFFFLSLGFSFFLPHPFFSVFVSPFFLFFFQERSGWIGVFKYRFDWEFFLLNFLVRICKHKFEYWRLSKNMCINI